MLTFLNQCNELYRTFYTNSILAILSVYKKALWSNSSFQTLKFTPPPPHVLTLLILSLIYLLWTYLLAWIMFIKDLVQESDVDLVVYLILLQIWWSTVFDFTVDLVVCLVLLQIWWSIWFYCRFGGLFDFTVDLVVYSF